MARPEVKTPDRLVELVDNVLDPIFKLTPLDKTSNWAEDVLEEFNGLPKTNSREIKVVKNLAAQSAAQLLQAPQYIDAAGVVWKKEKSLYELIRMESKAFMREKWEDVTSEQLAQLVRIYADNPQYKDFAKELLGNYFKGPKSKRQRVDAYYVFVSCVLDLTGDDKAFSEGVKIGLYDTDILVRGKDLIEQAILLSLPYNEKEIVFQKLLIAKNVMSQLSFLSSEDLGAVRQRHSDFLNTSEKLREKWEEEEIKAKKQIGAAKVIELIEAIMKIDSHYWKNLSEEEKLKLRNIWPFNLLFDKKDPLNKKFQMKISSKESKSLEG